MSGMDMSEAPIVNVDIFAGMLFRGFMKIGNFTCIKIHVLSILFRLFRLL